MIKMLWFLMKMGRKFMIAEFILIVSNVTVFGTHETIEGSFSTCDEAATFYESFYRGKDNFNGYRCIREDLIHKGVFNDK